MKNKLFKALMLSSIFLFPLNRATAQQYEIEQLLLNVEKLNQFRQILQQMHDAYKIISEGYDKVKEITSGNYKLHELFLDGLYLVNPEVRKYYKVPEIIQFQNSILKEHKKAAQLFRTSGAFNVDQLNYFDKVYKRFFDDSLEDLADLMVILSPGDLRMSDQERLSAIDRIHTNIRKKLFSMREFNSQHTMIAIQQLNEQSEQKTLRDLYGLP